MLLEKHSNSSLNRRGEQAGGVIANIVVHCTLKQPEESQKKNSGSRKCTGNQYTAQFKMLAAKVFYLQHHKILHPCQSTHPNSIVSSMLKLDPSILSR